MYKAYAMTILCMFFLIGCGDTVTAPTPEKPLVDNTVTTDKYPLAVDVYNLGSKQEYFCNSIHIDHGAVHLIDNGCGLTIFPEYCDSVNIIHIP